VKLSCELAWLGGERPERDVLIEVSGERIRSLTAGASAPPSDAERLEGLVIPGFANAHSHAFQRALRGRTHGDVRRACGGAGPPSPPTGGSFWTWREQMYALAEALTPDSMLSLARATFAEMALAGITLVGEFHYLHNGPGGSRYEDPNALGIAVVEAARQAGVRLTLLDTCYLHGGIGAPAEGAQLRFCDADAHEWAARVDQLAIDTASARLGAAIHSVRAVDPDSAATVARWASERGVPLHAHVSEQPAENEACLEAYGATPTELLFQAGALSERFTAVHATHISSSDLERLGAARACCCLCPTTERDLADGAAPAAEMRRAGARLAIGTDSHALIEPLEEARAIELDERLVSGVRGRHSPPELLHAATRGGYESLGWSEGGTIAEGALADLVAIRLDSVRLAGAAPEEAVAVFAAAAADVGDVIVGGRFVVRAGRHLSLDVPRELRDAVAGLAS
jgi:formiminoglutamate deiminase